DAVLDSAVAGGRDAPVEDELEVAKSPGSEQIFPDARLRRRLETAVLDRPRVSGRSLLVRVHPPFHGLSIEQENPARRFLFRGQRLCRRSEEGLRRREKGCGGKRRPEAGGALQGGRGILHAKERRRRRRVREERTSGRKRAAERGDLGNQGGSASGICKNHRGLQGMSRRASRE